MDLSSLISFYKQIYPMLMQGMFMTIQICLLGMVGGLGLGFILGCLRCNHFRLNKWIDLILHIIIVSIRGTPMFIQLLLVYFALPQILQIQLSPILAGVITLSLNSMAYISEIIRGGINGVEVAQWEACQGLGYSTLQSFSYIILPQTLRSILPALANELATLIKESSILMVIGVGELIKVGRDLVARSLKPMEVYLLVALIYLFLTTLLTILAKRIERRLA